MKSSICHSCCHTASAQQTAVARGYLAGLCRQNTASCTVALYSTELESDGHVHTSPDTSATYNRAPRGKPPSAFRAQNFSMLRRQKRNILVLALLPSLAPAFWSKWSTWELPRTRPGLLTSTSHEKNSHATPVRALRQEARHSGMGRGQRWPHPR